MKEVWKGSFKPPPPPRRGRFERPPFFLFWFRSKRCLLSFQTCDPSAGRRRSRLSWRNKGRGNKSLIFARANCLEIIECGNCDDEFNSNDFRIHSAFQKIFSLILKNRLQKKDPRLFEAIFSVDAKKKN